MYEDDYHPELSESDLEDFEGAYAGEADDRFEDGVNTFFFEEDFGETEPEKQARLQREAQAQQQARQQFQLQQGLQAGTGLMNMFTPLAQAGLAQAQADAEARRRRTQRPPSRPQRPPRRPRPQRPNYGPPPGYRQQQQMPMQMQQQQMQMQQQQQQQQQAAEAAKSDKKLMIYILSGTAVVVAGIGIYALVSGKK